MSRIVSTTPGLYPLPDWAKEDLKEYKGNQKSDLVSGDEGEEISTAYQEVRTELLDRQREAGLDRIVEGQARWDDMLAHPLAVHESVETRGIVRYFDNNNFYREPVVTGDLTPDGDVAAELSAAADLLATGSESGGASAGAAAEESGDAGGLQAVLPGPYTLADLATDEHYGDEAAFFEAVADFLAAEVEAFPAVETLTLLEPSLVENPPDQDACERLAGGIDSVTAGTDGEVLVQPYWGALDEKVYAHVMDADLDALGFDLVSAPDENVYNAQEYGTPDSVALGVVDGQNTLVETPETIRERVDWFAERTPQNDYDTVFVTTNTETFYLPVNRFAEKLDALAAATQVEVTA